jgi:hypothetical protein
LCEKVSVWASYPGICEAIVCCPQICCFDPGEDDPRITCISSTHLGRGYQQNDAAKAATGGILLFHHLDSDLTPEHCVSLLAAMKNPSITGGAFYRRFDDRHPGMKKFEGIERWHSRTWGALYGDQSIFVRKNIFNQLGGFPDYPLMEDVAFSKRLRNTGGLTLLDPPMSSSPRRHLEKGPWKTSLKNAMLLALYHLGLDPHLLFRWYYSNGSKATNASNLNHSTTEIKSPSQTSSI